MTTSCLPPLFCPPRAGNQRTGKLLVDRFEQALAEPDDRCLIDLLICWFVSEGHR
jgi:hypothetical protein